MAKSGKSVAKKQRQRRRCASLYSWRGKFLKELEQRLIVAAAAEAAGISDRTVRRHRAKDPKFDDACKAAVERAIDRLDAATYQDALSGNTTLRIFILKNRRRHIYGDQPATILDLAELVRRLAELPGAPQSVTQRGKHPVPTTKGNGRNGGGNGNP